MTDTCPRCSEPVIATPAGVLLDPLPHRLGVLRPDGSTLTVRDVLAQRRTGTWTGHHRHQCPPGSARAKTRAATPEPAGQTELFAVPDTADKPRTGSQ